MKTIRLIEKKNEIHEIPHEQSAIATSSHVSFSNNTFDYRLGSQDAKLEQIYNTFKNLSDKAIDDKTCQAKSNSFVREELFMVCAHHCVIHFEYRKLSSILIDITFVKD